MTKQFLKVGNAVFNPAAIQCVDYVMAEEGKVELTIVFINGVDFNYKFPTANDTDFLKFMRAISVAFEVGVK